MLCRDRRIEIGQNKGSAVEAVVALAYDIPIVLALLLCMYQ